MTVSMALPGGSESQKAVFWEVRDLPRDHKPSAELQPFPTSVPGQPSGLCLAWEVDSDLQREFRTNTYMGDQAVHFLPPYRVVPKRLMDTR